MLEYWVLIITICDHKTLQSGNRHSNHKTLQSGNRHSNQDKTKQSQDIAIKLRHKWSLDSCDHV